MHGTANVRDRPIVAMSDAIEAMHEKKTCF